MDSVAFKLSTSSFIILWTLGISGHFGRTFRRKPDYETNSRACYALWMAIFESRSPRKASQCQFLSVSES
ncbi:MAG: hypothetical protein O3A29_16745, partial [Planctomycetota bacterium]|nr:hypothetical protein [Planctomycetota bacterium]